VETQSFLTFIQTPSYWKAATRLIDDDAQREIELPCQTEGKVYLLEIFAKNSKISLTAAEKNEVRRLTRALERE
jgi:tRNA A37 N6-isopentenylltransferase MiaA